MILLVGDAGNDSKLGLSKDIEKFIEIPTSAR